MQNQDSLFGWEGHHSSSHDKYDGIWCHHQPKAIQRSRAGLAGLMGIVLEAEVLHKQRL